MNIQSSQLFLKMQPLKAKSRFKDTAIVLKGAYFCWATRRHSQMWWVDSASMLLLWDQCKQSLPDQPHWWLGTEGIQDRPAQWTRSSPCRDEGKQGLLLDPAQNTEPSHNMSTQCFCLKDVGSPVMSAFTIKHDFDINMVLMLLYLQCMMDPGSVRACLLFMRDFVFAMIGEQGVLEALFSCDLVNFLRIFL